MGVIEMLIARVEALEKEIDRIKKSEQEWPERMTVQQVAEYLNKAPGTIYNWISSGKVAPDWYVKGRPVFKREKVEKYRKNEGLRK